MVARRGAIRERTRTINRARALVLTGPDDLRTRFAWHATAALVARIASLRPRPGDVPGYATRVAVRELGRRAVFPDGRLQRLGVLIALLVIARAPGLLALYESALRPRRCYSSRRETIPDGSGPRSPGRICARPPRSPHRRGKVIRHRLNPGGDRQANHALWRIVFTRMGSGPATRAYVERRTGEGKSKAEIIRCLKRYVAREVYPHLRPAAG
jgi:hypothetical protein